MPVNPHFTHNLKAKQMPNMLINFDKTGMSHEVHEWRTPESLVKIVL